MFLGAAAGIMGSHLPGLPITPAVAVGMAAAVASVLRLPLTAVVIATLLVAHSGEAVGPLVIVAAVVSYTAALLMPTPSPTSP
jgi:H+/Cl- antiporter ClcA